MSIALVALIVSILSAGWAFAHNQRQTKYERVRQTRELFEKYMSQDMLLCRDIGWYILEDKINKEKNITFSSLWTEEDENKRMKYDNLYHVLEFWFLLYAMDRQNSIDRPLAKELFEYQYFHWKKQLAKLVANSKEKDWDRLDVLKPWLENNLTWLEYN